MISARYAAPVAVVLALALVPTVIHSYRGGTRDDGLRAAAIPITLDGIAGTPTGRRDAWVQRNFETADWVERQYRVDGADVTLFVARAVDAKRLYHHPELALLRGTETTPRGVAHAAARPDVPLHVLDTRREDRRGVAVYALLYDGRFIDDPLLFQLRASAELLVGGRLPMTILMSSDLAGARDTIDDAPATRVLLSAIREFEQQPVQAR